MGRTACTEPQCLYKGTLYSYFLTHIHAHAHTHTHTSTRAHTFTETHARARKHTHTNTTHTFKMADEVDLQLESALSTLLNVT
jgi:hypothetical protein